MLEEEAIRSMSAKKNSINFIKRFDQASIQFYEENFLSVDLRLRFFLWHMVAVNQILLCVATSKTSLVTSFRMEKYNLLFYTAVLSSDLIRIADQRMFPRITVQRS